MYDKDEVEEALELCNDINIYYKKQELENKEIPTSYKREESSFLKVLPEEVLIPKNPEKKEKKRILLLLKDFVSLLLCIFIAYGIARFITDYFVQPTLVEGISMEDTLFNDDILLIDKISYRFHDPKRFDVIVFPYSMRDYYVKRIIGLPGETIQIKDGSIYINDKKLLESFGKEPIEEAGIAAKKIILNENQYFLLGDNRNYSIDSRSEYVGPVEKEKLHGKVFARIYPFSQIKSFQ